MLCCRRRGQSKHEIVRRIRSVSHRAGELRENNGARQPVVAGLGCRSSLRYSEEPILFSSNPISGKALYPLRTQCGEETQS